MNSTPEQMLTRFRDMNPFATRWIRPGAIPYRFLHGETVETLVKALAKSNWWGEIVGPHGSGKSTLVAALTPAIEAAGRKVTRFSLQAGERKLTNDSRSDMQSWNADTQVIVDGYEQLGRWSKRSLKQTCRRRGAGLLVTAHSPQKLPPIFETSVSTELAAELIESLQPKSSRLLTDSDVLSRLPSHGQNLRELLFEMYDLYEDRRRRAVT